MTPGHGIGPGEVLAIIVGAFVLFVVPVLATIRTVVFVARQFHRSSNWGWIGLVSSVAVTVGFGIPVKDVGIVRFWQLAQAT